MTQNGESLFLPSDPPGTIRIDENPLAEIIPAFEEFCDLLCQAGFRATIGGDCFFPPETGAIRMWDVVPDRVIQAIIGTGLCPYQKEF